MSFVYQLYQQVCNKICVKYLTSTYAKFYTTEMYFRCALFTAIQLPLLMRGSGSIFPTDTTSNVTLYVYR